LDEDRLHPTFSFKKMKRKFPFVVGNIYHVYNRGVEKRAICNDETDRWRFLQGLVLFNDTKSTNGVLAHLERDRGELNLRVLRNYVVSPENERERLVRILAYCIMGNRYHLLVEEIREGGITQFMHKLGTGYVNYFNGKYERVGSLFQGRFKNVLVDNDQYLQYVLVYINVLNPAEFVAPNWKEQGIPDVTRALEYVEEYTWSTHLEYLGKRNSLIIEKGIFEKVLPSHQEYMELVHRVLEGKHYDRISDFG
jgi:putative transposase